MSQNLLDWTPELFSLKGKVALVTGGNTGLGQCYSVAYAKAGAKVFVATEFVDWEETNELLKQVEGAEYEFFKADLTKPEEISQLIPACVKRFGTIDILVNNAGIMRLNPPQDYTDEDWRAIFAVHVDATFFLSREAAKIMIPKKSGKIINVCSMMAYRGDPMTVGYTAVKHANAGITKAFATGLAPHGIQVNAIAPGFIKTAGNPPGMEAFADKIPAGRLGLPYDLMGLVVYLSSPASDYLNGQIIPIDGAYLVMPL